MTSEDEPMWPQAEQGYDFKTRFGIDTQAHSPAHLAIQSIEDAERQRLDLYETLLGLIQEGKWDCDQFIKKAQLDPEKLSKDCQQSRKEVKWSPDMPQSASKDGPEKHTQACLEHIACLELVLRDLYEIQTMGGSSAWLNCVFFFPGEIYTGWSWIVRLFAWASEHLAAVRVLNEWERYLDDRRRGALIKGSSSEGKNYDALIHALVKGLIQEDPKSKRPHSQSNLTLTDSCYSAIMDLWKDRPIFHFDDKNVRQTVNDSLVNLGKLAKRQKATFERRRRPVSFPDKPDGRSREVRAWKVWQEGISLSLLEVLEGRFGTVSNEEYDTITRASPEQLIRWLRQAGKADSVKVVLSKK